MLLKNDAEYRKLKVGGRRPLGTVSYWLSEVDLLLVEVSGFTERYRRYRLEEIKAIYASRNSRRLWVNLLCIVCFALLGVLPLFFAGGNPVPLVWGGVFAVVFGLVFLVNSFRGPTCTARIITAVHDAPLKGITRLAKVEPLIQAIRAATQPLPEERQTAEPTIEPEGTNFEARPIDSQEK